MFSGFWGLIVVDSVSVPATLPSTTTADLGGGTELSSADMVDIPAFEESLIGRRLRDRISHTDRQRRRDMQVKTYIDRSTLSLAAATHAAGILRQTIRDRGSARIVAATGTSQFEFLDALTTAPGIDWPRVEMFHLDEYVGLAIDHDASFRKYLLERLIRKTGITRYHLLDAEHDAARIADRVGEEISRAPIDVAFVGIGENGHLAFNDPPADFATERPYLIVTLDAACRGQQVGEGWFASIDEVPKIGRA